MDDIADYLKVHPLIKNLIRNKSCDIQLIPISSGGNNRVFRLQTDGDDYLLKLYFHHVSDTRDRLGNEYSFVSFAWQHDVRVVPKPIACDRDHFLGIYEFINGRKLAAKEITEDHIRQAINFFININAKKKEDGAKLLPIASEACFSIEDHIKCIEYRVELLRKIDSNDSLTNEAAKFICYELYPVWKKKRDRITTQASSQLDHQIPPQQRCLSPSDFGFQNVLLEENNRLRFIDFEYAGWDDPAKMVCDFFCQVAVPIPINYFQMFQDAVAEQFVESDMLRKRINLLFPLYQLKWCCIIMNDFLPAGNARRIFADSSDYNARKRIQLEKSHLYFSKMIKD